MRSLCFPTFLSALVLDLPTFGARRLKMPSPTKISLYAVTRDIFISIRDHETAVSASWPTRGLRSLIRPNVAAYRTQREGKLFIFAN